MIPALPPFASPVARTAWRNAAASCVGHGLALGPRERTIEKTARCAAFYVALATVVAIAPARFGPRAAAQIGRARLTVRRLMASISWIDAAEPLPPLRSDGLDPDVARLCGLPEDEAS